MRLMVIFGFLLTLGFVQSQECAGKNPNVAAPKTWVPNPGCPGKTWYNTDNGATRCHCWSFCGYICEPNPFSPAPAPPTTIATTVPTTVPTTIPTTKPTTVAPCPIIYVPNQTAPTYICVCPSGSSAYNCMSVGG